MRYAPLILSFMIAALISFSSLTTAARFSTGSISTNVGKNVELLIIVENTENSATSNDLEISVSPESGGDAIFEETGTGTMNVYLLPSETKEIHATFTAGSTGSFSINLITDGTVTNSIYAQVTDIPEFPETDVFFLAIAVLFAIIIFGIFIRGY